MKYILFLLLFSCGLVNKIQAQSLSYEQIAQKIAKKMKDSLTLSDRQFQQLYAVNIQLHQQKQSIWQQHLANDSLTQRIQLIENSRDSLYHPILNDSTYSSYLKRKRNLVSNN